MLLGTEPLAAIAALDPLDIDVLGMNCATGPTDMREHVRTLARSSRLPISIVPNAGIPEMVDGADLLPARPAGPGRRPARVRVRARRVDRRRLLRHHARAPARRGRGRRGPGAPPPRAGPAVLRQARGGGAARPPARRGPTTPRSMVEYRPALASLYAAAPIEQDTSFLVIGERANANGSKAFRELLLERGLGGDGRAGQVPDPRGRPRAGRVRGLRGPRRRAGHGRGRRPVRDPVHPAAGARLHRDRRGAGRAGAPRRPRGHQLGQPRGRPSQGRRAAARRQAVRGGGGRAGHRRGGPGPHRRLEGRVCKQVADIADRRVRARAAGPHLRLPDVPARVRPGGPARRREGDPRGHPSREGRDPRLLHDAGRVQRLVRPVAGRPPGAELGVPADGDRRRAGLRDRAPGQDPAAAPHRRRAGPGRHRPRARPPRARPAWAAPRARTTTRCTG